MSMTLNIRTDAEVKENAEKIFSELGLTMSTAINMFLKATIRENGIPFDLKIEKPNKETSEAIEEGKKLAYDASAIGYRNMDSLKAALEV